MLLRHSHELYEAAAATPNATDFTVLIGPQGQIQLIANSDWPLDSLRLDRGADMAFRVTTRSGHVQVTGKTATRTCRLETETPAAIARRLLR